jgi:hypothetical protein
MAEYLILVEEVTGWKVVGETDTLVEAIKIAEEAAQSFYHDTKDNPAGHIHIACIRQTLTLFEKPKMAWRTYA